MSQESFLTKVKEALPDLHPAEKRLAEFLIDFPGEIASYDAQELAGLCKVSKATVSRFVRRLGFDNYDHARKAVREESQTGSRLFFGHAETEAGASTHGIDLAEERELTDWTFQRIDPAELNAVAEVILSARKVWIIGQRIGHSFATYLYWQLTKVIANSAVVPQAGETLGEHIAAMEPDDLVIFVALRRRMKGTEDVLSEIRQVGAKIALISDEGMTYNTSSTWHFRCRTQTSSPQFNHTAVMSLCHQLVVQAMLKSGHDSRARLLAVDSINERLGFYE